MSLKSYIRDRILGRQLSQEYVCLSKEKLSHPLKMVLPGSSADDTADITDRHLFLGYQPLIIAVPCRKNEIPFNLADKPEIDMYLFAGEKPKEIASLKLRACFQENFNHTTLFVFEGVKGEHQFISSFYRFTNKLYSKWRENKDDSLLLSETRYEQLRIAYAIPRIISIATVGDGKSYNMFPTDLNGAIDEDNFVISLRHGGQASEQVRSLKKLCLSTVPVSYFREAYLLGKNHMQPLYDRQHFDFHNEASERFGLPLPAVACEYQELELNNFRDVGIHRLYFFKIINEKRMAETGDTLAHMHSYYLHWRKNNGYETTIYLR